TDALDRAEEIVAGRVLRRLDRPATRCRDMQSVSRKIDLPGVAGGADIGGGIDHREDIAAMGGDPARREFGKARQRTVPYRMRARSDEAGSRRKPGSQKRH